MAVRVSVAGPRAQACEHGRAGAKKARGTREAEAVVATALAALASSTGGVRAAVRSWEARTDGGRRWPVRGDGSDGDGDGGGGDGGGGESVAAAPVAEAADSYGVGGGSGGEDDGGYESIRRCVEGCKFTGTEHGELGRIQRMGRMAGNLAGLRCPAEAAGSLRTSTAGGGWWRGRRRRGTAAAAVLRSAGEAAATTRAGTAAAAVMRRAGVMAGLRVRVRRRWRGRRRRQARRWCLEATVTPRRTTVGQATGLRVRARR